MRAAYRYSDMPNIDWGNVRSVSELDEVQEKLMSWVGWSVQRNLEVGLEEFKKEYESEQSSKKGK